MLRGERTLSIILGVFFLNNIKKIIYLNNINFNLFMKVIEKEKNVILNDVFSEPRHSHFSRRRRPKKKKKKSF